MPALRMLRPLFAPVFAAAATTALVAACSGSRTTPSDSAAAAAPTSTGSASTPAPSAAPPAVQVASAIPDGMRAIRVFKDPACGCCKSWIAHMQQNGFQVTAVDEPPQTLDSIKTAHGITSTTASCHTAEVGNYVIEGHVPADLVVKLLRDHPADIVGLTVPGMVTGSPGMDGPNPQHYAVLAMLRDGSTRTYASR